MTADSHHIYWGDSHHNTYQFGPQDPPIGEVLKWASTYLDFYTGAYYTPMLSRVAPKDTAARDTARRTGHPVDQLGAAGDKYLGVYVEDTKPALQLQREWREFEAATKAALQPGQFVPFPGYEWQGNGLWGDHNVTFKNEGADLAVPDTIDELYAALRGRDAIAIPHHTAYRTGVRAPHWSHTDTTISPYAELYSCHGCSETDEEIVGLRHNSHMGPGGYSSTYAAALDRGLHIGAVCSTDNWTNTPGCWNQGLMACLATDLTRDALWDAFTSRRVYGVTGDRIELQFACNDHLMGEQFQCDGAREFAVNVRGVDAIDRIELLRNNQVIATQCHQGQWSTPAGSAVSRFKLRVELGWGPHAGELPSPPRNWAGMLTLSSGKMLGVHPCWVTPNQPTPTVDGGAASFGVISPPQQAHGRYHNALVFEFESPANAPLELRIDDQIVRATPAELCAGAQVLWWKDESAQLIQQAVGIDATKEDRLDTLYHSAWKARVHRCIPEAGYVASLRFTDNQPLDREAHYRVRVEQRNGQRAWSSPIWVKP